MLFSGAASLANPGTLTISIGGAVAAVSFAGLLEAGLYQFNLLVPQLPDGDQPVAAQINGVTGSQSVYLAIRN